jgi:hypothetical protein
MYSTLILTGAQRSATISVTVSRTFTGTFTGTFSIQLHKSSFILPLNKECTLSLYPLRHFGLYWIHAFKVTLEFLEAVFLGKFRYSSHPSTMIRRSRVTACKSVGH